MRIFESYMIVTAEVRIYGPDILDFSSNSKNSEQISAVHLSSFLIVL